MKLLIQGGRVIDPDNKLDAVQDLYIADGKIAALGRAPLGFTPERTIDAGGRIVCPGLVDLKARLREPGFEHKGTIASETRAAAAGGVTTLCCPPDTDPVIDAPAVVESLRQRAARAGRARVVPLGALTRGLEGQILSEMYALKQAGCVGVTNLTRPITIGIMRRAMEYAASQGLTVFYHPEDVTLAGQGCAHEGKVAVRLGLPGIPESAETVAVAQMLALIEQLGVRVHFSQISTARAVRMLARAQFDGLPVSADVAAHQLFLTEMDLGFFDSQCHLRPPLRTERDRDGLRAGLAQGTLTAICSDHQPHDTDAKLAPFPSSEAGMSALETLLPLTLRLVDEGLMNLSEALSRVTALPARILGLDVGTLGVGRPADVCVIDAERYWQLTTQSLYSAGHNTPFLNWEFKGRVTHTLLGGRLVHEAAVEP